MNIGSTQCKWVQWKILQTDKSMGKFTNRLNIFIQLGKAETSIDTMGILWDNNPNEQMQHFSLLGTESELKNFVTA